MDDLVNKVAQTTGLSAEMVKKVLTTAAGFLKDKLPAPLAAQLEGYLSGAGAAGGEGGQAGGGGGLADLAGKIGGMFGGGKS